MYILDTDILTHLYAGHSRVINRLQNIEDSSICITIITKIEMLQGRFSFLLKAATAIEIKKAQHWLQLTEELLSQIVVIPFDEAALNQFERLRYSSKLKKIGHADILIASIALANHATIVTRNTRHFQQIPNLKAVNWMD